MHIRHCLLILFLFGITFAWIFSVVPNAFATSEISFKICDKFHAISKAPTPWGQPYRILPDSGETIMSIKCDGATTAEAVFGQNGNPNIYMHEQFYIYNGLVWVPYTIPDATNGWVSGQKTIPIRPTTLGEGTNFVAGYFCENAGSTSTPNWKCGCHDELCESPYWNLQAFDARTFVDDGLSKQPSGNSSSKGSSEATNNNNGSTSGGSGSSGWAEQTGS